MQHCSCVWCSTCDITLPSLTFLCGLCEPARPSPLLLLSLQDGGWLPAGAAIGFPDGAGWRPDPHCDSGWSHCCCVRQLPWTLRSVQNTVIPPPLMLRSHSISLTRSQGTPQYRIALGRGKDGRVGHCVVATAPPPPRSLSAFACFETTSLLHPTPVPDAHSLLQGLKATSTTLCPSAQPVWLPRLGPTCPS